MNLGMHNPALKQKHCDEQKENPSRPFRITCVKGLYACFVAQAHKAIASRARDLAILMIQFALPFRCQDCVPPSDKAKSDLDFDCWFVKHTNPIKHDANKPHWNRISLFEPDTTKQLWDII
jgi:hypothetical protein